MIDQNKKELIFDNILPREIGKNSKELDFHDQNDLIRNSKKSDDRRFAKKTNLVFFIIVQSFTIFIVINLVFLSLDVNKSRLDDVKIKVNRGEILDRNGEVLAASIDTKDFYINTSKILEQKKLISELENLFPNKSFESTIEKKNKHILIKKNLSPLEINQLKKIGNPGIVFLNSQKRVYPQHNIFSHLVGFKINNLKSKLERNFDNVLSNGKDIKLTVDLKIQNIVRDELIKGLDSFKAKSALSVVMNVKNGEIIAMVSLPDFDPNFPKTIQAFTENNLVTEARYEMGSTLKMFNAALAFEFDKEITKKEFNIANGYQITEEKKITDEHINKEIINFDEVFIHSSNVASVKIIDLIGIEEQQNLFRKIGLVENPKINGLNIVSNKAPKIWNETSSKFISYGYGISLSPISLVSAFSTLVNGGFKISPKIFKEESYISEEKVLFTTTSKKINNLLKEIVKKGTGRKANVNGLELGGKTGTSKKVEKGKYSEKKVITSFIGAFPIDDPNFITFVLFDEPKRNTGISLESFGSNTAAPTFSNIVRKISPILNQKNYFKYSKNEN